MPDSHPHMLGVDVGTTHCKAGLFAADGSTLAIARRATPLARSSTGLLWHDAQELWHTVAAAIAEVIQRSGGGVDLVGVTSMAEAGLLVDRASGTPRTDIIPWHDRRSAPQAERLANEESALDLYRLTGLHASYKFGLPKLSWLRENDAALLKDAVWLSVADYIVFRLTGRCATDPTLAARTFAYDIGGDAWIDAWIRQNGLDVSLFPAVLASGAQAGSVTREGTAATGITHGTPVGVSGHDHICALMAAAIVQPGSVLDSVGTAESMLGVLPPGSFPAAAFDSGLAIVPHVLPALYCWLGGLSAAGGSVEWLRGQLAEGGLSQEAFDRLVDAAGPDPTTIVYIPYLSGSGAPRPDQNARACFLGLAASHGRPHLARAVLEGTAFASEAIRRTAERLIGEPICELTVVGGGSGNARWTQIRADVTGCTCTVPAIQEATLLGAAMTASVAMQHLSLEDAQAAATRMREAGSIYQPDRERAETYRRIFDHFYVPIQEPLLGLGKTNHQFQAPVQAPERRSSSND